MDTNVKIYHWIPRILCIMAILFISMFSLDAFEPNLSIGQQILGFLIHNIPSFVLIALLVVTWKWEYIGGIIFCLIGALFSIPIFLINYARNQSLTMSLLIILMITIPFVLVGVLFIVSYNKKKKSQSLS